LSSGLSVSLCVIARDEEQSIGACISSVGGLVREVVVVDTGSADRTAELAAEAGARVFNFPWRDDFAAARNYALDQATGDWILVLDADEILEPVEPEELVRLLAVSDVEGYFVKIYSYLGNGEGVAKDQVVRLFRNKPAYRFEGAIHEQVAGAIKRKNSGGGLAFSELVIHHFGYLDRVIQGKNKKRRNILIIEKALAQHPDDPFLLFSLGTEYCQGGETLKGIEQLEKALSFARGNEGYFRDLLIALGAGLLKAGRKDDLTVLLEQALIMLPGDADLHLLKGVSALKGGRGQAAVEELRRALEGGSELLPTHCIHSLLGDACSISGRFREAEDEYFTALRLGPNILYPLTQLLGLKQQGTGRVEWSELSRFATPAAKRVIVHELTRLGEFPVALVVALLRVVDAANAGKTAELPEVCRECEISVRRCLDNGFGQKLFRDYLLAAGDEMLLYAEAARRGFSCGLFSPVQGLLRLVEGTLELVVRGL